MVGLWVNSLDRSSRLCRARILGLRASSKFKARADTFVVSTNLCRLGLGGRDFDAVKMLLLGQIGEPARAA
jgi:hypothetical protein